jgi:two-component system CheB/CheR fusion protein
MSDLTTAEGARGTVGCAGIPTPIVGIGASAGGLEALRQLFSGLPDDTGMAYSFPACPMTRAWPTS